MRIHADIKLFDGEQSYAPGTDVPWPAGRPLPIQVGANVRPAHADDAAEVYAALRKQFAAKINEFKLRLKSPSVKAEQAEMIQREIARLEADAARVPEVAPRGSGAAKLDPVPPPDPLN